MRAAIAFPALLRAPPAPSPPPLSGTMSAKSGVRANGRGCLSRHASRAGQGAPLRFELGRRHIAGIPSIAGIHERRGHPEHRGYPERRGHPRIAGIPVA